MARPKLYRRFFLNHPGFHTRGYLLVKAGPQKNPKRPGGAWANAAIGDCGSDINLEFSFTSAASKRNAVDKARRLSRAFEDLGPVPGEPAAHAR